MAFEGHHYSVPHQHVGQAVELRITGATLEVLLRRQRIAAHARSAQDGEFSIVAQVEDKALERAGLVQVVQVLDHRGGRNDDRPCERRLLGDRQRNREDIHADCF